HPAIAQGSRKTRISIVFSLYFCGEPRLGSLYSFYSCSLIRRQEQANRNPKGMVGAAQATWGAREQPPRSGTKLARRQRLNRRGFYKNASVRISMLSRGRALGGEVGSSNAVWADQRARPSFAESKTLNTSASSRRMRGSQYQRCSGL